MYLAVPFRILTVAAALVLLAAAPAVALTADEMYDPRTVVVIDIDLPPQSVAALEAEPDEYVEGTFSVAETDGTPAGIAGFSAPIDVGVRLKGETSFRNLSGKAAFKIKFDEFVEDQEFLGLQGLTLNNMVQDPSMVRETLAYETFRSAGVPAPRSGYADVRVNGEEFGLHLNLETLGEAALARLFGSFQAPPQHLYEGGPSVDVVPGDAGAFEIDEGEDDRADLEALIAAVAAPSPPFSQRAAAFADLDEMTRMWAVERYIAHFDGYSADPEPNNYYLYSDAVGAFQMLPWGTDQAWVAQIGFGPSGPVLFEACFADPPCAALYRNALLQVRDLVAALNPGAEAKRLAALLAPWQQLEVAPRKPFGPAEIAAAVNAIGEFAANRPGALAQWLAAPGSGAAGAQAQPAARASRLSRKLHVNRAKLGRGLLRVWVNVPGAGTVRLASHIATVDGRIPACTDSRIVTKAGPLALQCRLSPTVRRHLAARWIRLRLSVTLALHGEGPYSHERAVRLPSAGS